MLPYFASNIIFAHTKAPHCVHMRGGVKFGDTPFKDTMLQDGLMDAFHDIHMGITGMKNR